MPPTLCLSLREPAPEQGTALSPLLEDLFAKWIPRSFTAPHPGYLAYIPGGGLFPAALADFISNTTNRYTGVWQASPALVTLEANALDWLREWMGFPPEARGLFTAGGSMATFNAILCARERHLGAEIRRGVLYTSDQAHHSVLKSAKLAGIMPDRVRALPCDGDYRLPVGALREAIAKDRRDGLTPFAVVSSAGTTNTGAVDPLDAIADLCAAEGLWHHVDGAYGAFFYLCDELKPLLRGLPRADSLTLDPHKGMFLPYGTGALLVRDGSALRAAHEATADYLPAMPHPDDFYDPSQHGPDLSRGFPGLRVWLSVKLFGSAAFRGAVTEKRALTLDAARRIAALPHVVMDAPPELSLFAFHLTWPGATLEQEDAATRLLMDRTTGRGRVMITGAVARGRYLGRVCVLSFRTHQGEIDATHRGPRGVDRLLHQCVGGYICFTQCPSLTSAANTTRVDSTAATWRLIRSHSSTSGSRRPRGRRRPGAAFGASRSASTRASPRCSVPRASSRMRWRWRPSGGDGKPSVRMVLVKGVDARGFVFYTNYGSRKGRELAANPNASLVFYWPDLERQVNIAGAVTRLPRDESEAYFHSRPRGSQIAALASEQSSPVRDRATLEAKVTRTPAQVRRHGRATPGRLGWLRARAGADRILAGACEPVARPVLLQSLNGWHMAGAATATLSESPAAARALRTRFVLWFWLPLAATWLMMSVEGPYIAAIIARMPDAAYNLAAFGVAFSLSWLAESPIMMLLTASNKLVGDRQSFLATRRFAYALNAFVTLLMLVAVVPPVFSFLTATLMGLPPEVSSLVHTAMMLLVLWPASIGYRRFYQGILVRNHLTRRVAYGTVIRLVTMSVAAAVLAFTTHWHGSSIGAFALGAGVLLEAAASRWMARHLVSSILAGPETTPHALPLTQRAIAHFYYPLALTSMISMVTGPLLTFFMGRSRAPLESLAVLPVVQTLVFMFRSGGVAFQEVGVALSGRHHEHEREVGRTSLMLASAFTLALAVMLFTPLAHVWFRDVAGLSPALADFALTPARLLVLIPAMEYWLSFQRSRFILNGQTRVITIATALEVGGITFALVLCITQFGMIGVVAGSVGLVAGRLASNVFLHFASRARPAS